MPGADRLPGRGGCPPRGARGRRAADRGRRHRLLPERPPRAASHRHRLRRRTSGQQWPNARPGATRLGRLPGRRLCRAPGDCGGAPGGPVARDPALPLGESCGPPHDGAMAGDQPAVLSLTVSAGLAVHTAALSPVAAAHAAAGGDVQQRMFSRPGGVSTAEAPTHVLAP